MKWVLGVLSPAVKWLGREADHSPPSIADVTNAWNYNSTPPYVFMVWCLVKYTIRLHVMVLSETSVYMRSVSKSFRTGRLEPEQQMIQLSTSRCSCTAILWVSLVSFASITLCFAPQRDFIFVVVYFVIDSVRKLLDTPSQIVSAL
jgi:hypothetical protein